jgi:hypothetical protein
MSFPGVEGVKKADGGDATQKEVMEEDQNRENIGGMKGMKKSGVLFAALLLVVGLNSTAMALTWNVLEGSFLMESVGGDPAITIAENHYFARVSTSATFFAPGSYPSQRAVCAGRR